MKDGTTKLTNNPILFSITDMLQEPTTPIIITFIVTVGYTEMLTIEMKIVKESIKKNGLVKRKEWLESL